MRPYLGVSCLAFSALNSAFSAPRICTVDDGCFARFIKDPGTSDHFSVGQQWLVVTRQALKSVTASKFSGSGTVLELLINYSI